MLLMAVKIAVGDGGGGHDNDEDYDENETEDGGEILPDRQLLKKKFLEANSLEETSVLGDGACAAFFERLQWLRKAESREQSCGLSEESS